MAKSPASTKTAKLSRAEKKQQRADRRAGRRDTWRNMRQAFTLTRKNDNRLIPYMIIAGVGLAAIIYVVVLLISGSWWIGIPVSLLFGVAAAMLIFSRRAQTSMYRQAEDQPGAAAWILQNQVRGDWHTTPAVVGTSQLDAVHRVIGRPGIVLIGEGAPQRVRGLLAQEKKKIARVAGDTPIYDVIVGRGDGEVALGKLSSYLVKLPRNLSKEQVVSLEKRIAALGGARQQVPQGPLPPGAKMRNVQRAARRRG